MSLKRKLSDLRRTLAFRLTLWYAGIFSVSCCLVFLVFYLLINAYMREQIDRELLDQERTISSVLSVQGVHAVKKIAILEAQATGEKKVFIRLLARNGSVFSSSNMSYWKNIPVKTAAISHLVREGGGLFDTVTLAGRRHKVRILYKLLDTGLILQLGQSMESQSRVIEAFEKIFVFTISALVFIAALVGWFMARKALSKMALVTRTAQNISDGALDKRVPVTPYGDEVDQLATTFNHMLDYIETLIAGIKEMNDNIAHDLKSPVTRIRGIAEVTMTRDVSLKSYEQMSASIIEECDRLLDMINTMLVISKTEAGVDTLTIEKLDLAAVIRDACELFRASAEDKAVRMTCRAIQEIMMDGDTRMLQRMVANLIDNAIRYTPAGGTVEVSLHSGERQEAVVTVTDTGIGISPEELPHIFERFYRCDPSRSESGTGLGLSLALAVARAHGGRIDAYSLLGRGSTFTVTLPRSRKPFKPGNPS